MSDDASTTTADIIAVVGETVSLQFETTDTFDGNVQFTFTVSQLGSSGGGAGQQTSWVEEHAPTPAPGGAALKRFSADWVVDLRDADFRKVVAIVTFTVTGKAANGSQVVGRALNRLRVPGIAVTADANLQQIMLHEFVTISGPDYVFDQAKVQSIVDGLSVAQRKLLATYDIGSKSDRLVVFATLQPSPRRLMYADACRPGQATSVHANATLSVFHSTGKGNLVTLLCHTDNMVINTVNPDTRRLLSGAQGSLAAAKWLSVNNPKPPKFVVGSHAAHFTDSVVWSRLFTAQGVDVMPGNSIHGIINTVGCWMLFRNYNWPVPHREELFRIYATMVRTRKPKATILAALAAAGYDVPSPPADPPPTATGSGAKFMYCDLNYAYSYFFRYVVGIDFFSNTNTFYKRYANMYKTHGMTFENTFPLSEVPSSGYLYHDVDSRRAEDKSFQPGPAQWIPNAAGFKTADSFLPDATWSQNITAAQAKSFTWADWYLYKPDDVSLSDALAAPVTPYDSPPAPNPYEP